MAATWDFRPTHVVPQAGMPAWEAPDVSRPTTPLDPLLPVQLAERRGDWGRIVCANNWSAWVDGRLLVPVPQEPPAAGRPPARTADPRPLLARAGETLARYRRAVEDLADGVSDGETFRDRTRGLRVGLVVDGESMWLYDAEHERWVYCDGLRLNTFAASSGPSQHADARGGDDAVVHGRDPATGHEPTRVVPPGAPGAAPAGPGTPGGAPPPTPTRVVTPQTPPGAGGRDGSADRETELVEQPAPRDEERPDAPRAVGRPDAPRAVEEPDALGAVEEPEATRVVERPAQPDRTRAVEHPDTTPDVDQPDATRAVQEPDATRAVEHPERPSAGGGDR
ncbi:hypothetical protein [Streptomyces peucetius]|uniref:hypothetical protein n=1 Tax=Streptomyces peucetius TaxID=1950 RepID=UPI0039B114A4